MPQTEVSIRPKSPHRTTQFEIAAELSRLPAANHPPAQPSIARHRQILLKMLEPFRPAADSISKGICRLCIAAPTLQGPRSAKGRRGDTQATNPLRDGVWGGGGRGKAFFWKFPGPGCREMGGGA